MNHVLSIQDISCVGRCSLTAALPVYSAMGLRCSVLPTAVLSTHTGFPRPQAVDLTDRMLPFARHWRENHIQFDGISVGYLSGSAQGEAVAALLSMQENHPLVVVDPVLGDNGRLYDRITPDHVRAMARLCARARLIVPNLTEAACLTGTPWEEASRPEGYQSLLPPLLEQTESVVITGVPFADGTLGVLGATRGQAPFVIRRQRIPGSFHGTGDLFSAVITGCLLLGQDLESAAGDAVDFVLECIQNSPPDSPHGVAFEPQLYHLTEKVRQGLHL